jgi:metal-responsive CopG/Arc/MetJ family transcriptional regulator
MAGESTTLALPSDLLAALDQLVQEGRARSREELIESAVRREVAERRRAALDAEFLFMAEDADYHKEARRILAEFAQADAETLGNEPAQERPQT